MFSENVSIARRRTTMPAGSAADAPAIPVSGLAARHPPSPSHVRAEQRTER